MLDRSVKVAYYLFSRPLTKLNGFLYRHFRAPRSGHVKVHLGPGQKRYIDGWLNIDSNIFTGKADVWADLRDPLPFHSDTIDAVYSHHVIEHLPNLQQHFREVHRCLRPGGVYRVGGPNGDSAIAKFVQGDSRWFSSWPDNRESLGGRFENFIFCRHEHLTILTLSFLDELMRAAGFIDIRLCKPVKETNYPDLFTDCLSKEHESDFAVPHTLIVEAVKPVR